MNALRGSESSLIILIPETNKLNELIFLVQDAPEGGFTAQALGASIFTQADTWAELQQQVRDAVACHFDEAEKPKLIRLHCVRDEVIAA
jgi:hypothetical protein